MKSNSVSYNGKVISLVSAQEEVLERSNKDFYVFTCLYVVC